ncbi:MAG: DUF1127 domain-containing protein [Pseudomonadota bacterium]
MAQTHTAPALTYLAAQTHLPAASVLAVRVAALLSAWATRRRTRAALAQLDRSLLRDVGLTPDAADHEARKVFWLP